MTVFSQKAPWIMALLMRDFGLDDISAAAILGNLGHESGGLTNFQEDNPTVPGSRGGFGWAQWTGPRRVAFEAYCQRNRLDTRSDQANYGFLFVELKGSERAGIAAVKRSGTLNEKTKAFEANFERAGVKHYTKRNRWAAIALEAYRSAAKPVRLPVWVKMPMLPKTPQVPAIPQWSIIGLIGVLILGYGAYRIFFMG